MKRDGSSTADLSNSQVYKAAARSVPARIRRREVEQLERTIERVLEPVRSTLGVGS